MKETPTIKDIKINPKKAAHPITEDITKSPNKFLFPSFIIQRYTKYIEIQNKFKIKKPNLAMVGF